MPVQSSVSDDVDLARDRALVERFQAGDVGAFDELYRRYFPRLVRYCRRRVGDGHVAEEVAQEAFARALVALPSLTGERRFYPWMTVIARRLCIDHARSASRVRPRAEIDLGALEGADEDLLVRERARHVAAAMERVKERHRDVLILREHEGLSYDAIADRLHAPVSTVETLLHRARGALRREVLAVAGPGGLAALPVLGPLARAFRGVRRELATRWPGALPDVSALAAPLAATAVAVAVSLPGPSGPDPAPGPVSERDKSPARTEVTPPVGPSPGRSGGAPDAGPAPSPTAPAGEDGVSVTPPPDPGSPVHVWTGPEGARRAREESEDLPVRTDAGPFFVGADPTQSLDEILEAPSGLLGGGP